jgi:hypothetical protein
MFDKSVNEFESRRRPKSPLIKGRCEKMILSIANSGKSPLSPPFDHAQGMLFQRGGTCSRKSGIINLPSKTLPSFFDHSPFEKGGQKGGFEFFHSFGGI